MDSVFIFGQSFTVVDETIPSEPVKLKVCLHQLSFGYIEG